MTILLFVFPIGMTCHHLKEVSMLQLFVHVTVNVAHHHRTLREPSALPGPQWSSHVNRSQR